MSFHERRRNPRIDVLGQVHIQIVTCPVPASLREISLGGFSIETTSAFPPGQLHDFHFFLDDGTELSVRATSVHCALVKVDSGLLVHLSGFEFIQRDSQVRDDVETFVERIMSMIAVA